MRQALRVLGLVGALGGCAWLPFVGSEPEADPTAQDEAPEAAQAPADGGICRRKGRGWPEGSRVCEDHVVTRCFPDGNWYAIGSC